VAGKAELKLLKDLQLVEHRCAMKITKEEVTILQETVSR